MIDNEYKHRINKVIDHIEKNLVNNFSLDELAKISNFSKYHFSRIFQDVTGETSFQLILRLRLEKAASLLSHGNDSISDIAHKCGFKSLPVFSKNFKSHFKESATSFRSKNSNLDKVNSISDKSNKVPSIYICNQTKSIKWKIDMKNNESIEIKDLPSIPVVYVRHIGPYQGDVELFESLFSKLFAWAGPKGLLDNGDFQTAIVYHDDVNVADKSKLRTSVCLTAPANTKVDGEIGKMEIEMGKYVVAKFTVKADEFQQAWDWLMGKWFPVSGYQPDDKACFELYTDEPENGVFKVDICVPVRKL
jgi:AraC family transcriptional regulator